MNLRRWAERFTRNRVLKRRLPADFGRLPILVTPDSALQFLKPSLASQSMSAPLLQLARRYVRPGAVVWDIGANVGVFTFAAAVRAGAAGEVVAVEPDFMLAWLLQQTAIMHRRALPCVHIVSAAVAAELSMARLEIAERGRASNSIMGAIGRSQTGGVRYVQDTVTISLDSLLHSFRRPDLVKIDVEGAELLALQGARQLLTAVRPVMYIEVGDEQAEAVGAIFSNSRYRLFDGEAPELRPVDRCVFNTLAVPEEQLAGRLGLSADSPSGA